MQQLPHDPDHDDDPAAWRTDEVPPDAWTGKLAPLLALFDVLGRRWSLRVIWELQKGPATFRQLRERSGDISSSVLTDRLRELRGAGVAEHRPGEGYALTELGCGLGERIIDIYFWLRQQPGWPADDGAPTDSGPTPGT